jgi:hypothetical protein
VLKKPSRTSDAAPKDEPAKGSSLERLADFTRRIIKVPKREIDDGKALQSPTPPTPPKPKRA